MNLFNIGIVASALSTLLLGGCLLGAKPPGAEDTGGFLPEDTDEEDTGTPPIAAAWIEVEVGYCQFHSSPDGGANWSATQTVNEDGSGDPVRLTGGVGELLELFCDWSVVPQYDLPAATVDPASCAQVYCDGAGHLDRDACEDPDNLWAYVYAPGTYPSDDCDTGHIGG